MGQGAFRVGAKNLGRPLLLLEVAESTQDIVREAALRGMREGFTVVAERLTKARGRLGRSFYAAKGGLYFSLLLKPGLKARSSPIISLAAGVAVAKSIEDLGLGCWLKWPNDCLTRSRKVCGILLESASIGDEVLYLILGVGLNANIPLEDLPEDIRDEATTLMHELRRPVQLPKVLNSILTYFEELYEEIQRGHRLRLLKEWSQRDILSGKNVEVEHLGERVRVLVKGVSEEGALLVEHGGDLLELSAADSILL